MSDVHELIFKIDNPCNTTIVDSGTRKVLYEVATEHGETTVTDIKNSTGETIGLGCGRTTVTLQDNVGRKFKWKGNAPGLSLELYAEDNKKEPLVRFQKSRTIGNSRGQPPTSTTEPARLIMDVRGVEIQDMAVVSFLVLEKSRRARENSADSIGIAPIGIQ